MDINVNDLLDGYSKNIKLEKEIKLPKSTDYNENIIVKIDGNIKNYNGKYILCAKMFTAMSLNCSSCLCPFEKSIDISIKETFSKNNIDNEEIWKFSSEDNNICLKAPIITNVLLSLPMKAICSDKCKGLCIKCAHNLNNGECGCDRGFIDPRFEKILHLFENKEG